MKKVNAGLVLSVTVVLIFCGGCDVYEKQHNAELKAQAERYEQQLKDQRQQYGDEIKRKQVWFVIILIATNATWCVAFWKKA